MAFTISPTSLPGVMVIDVEAHEDERGAFSRLFCRDELQAAGLNPELAQASLSRNPRLGTLRGLHFQRAPHEETKLVACPRGAIFDVAVDVRSDSPTFGRWVSAELTEANRRMLYIPPGFAHGFQTLVPDTDVLYFISTRYAPASAAGLRFDDPNLAIAWPDVAERVVSERDRAHPSLEELRAT